MLKLLLIFFISNFLVLGASTLHLTQANKKYEDFNIQYSMDKNFTYTIQNIQDQEFHTIKNEHAFSGNTGAVWYRITLKNIADIDKKIYLHNNFAYFSKNIEIFELQDKKLLRQHTYDILEDSTTNALTGATLIYKLYIPSDTSRTIYIKNTPMVSNLFDLNIYEEKDSREVLMNRSFYSIFIISIMFTLAMYNTILFVFNRRKEFIYYALYMITPTIGLMYKYGIFFSHFHLYGENTYWFNLTAILMPAFLILFIKQVLDTGQMHKKINYILNTILFIIILDVLSALFIDLTFAMEMFKIMFIFTTAALIYLSIYLMRTSHPLAKIFLFAYSVYVLGLIITILSMSGITEMNFFTFHSGGIGIIFEGLLFSYLMHYNIKILEEKINQQREVIIAKNKKAQLGDMISAITHQWKQPLSRMASITTLLEFKIQTNGEVSPRELDEKIQLINYNIHFLSSTIDDFKDFFNPSANAKESDIAEIINSAINITKDDSVLDNILINQDLQFEKKIKTYKNELLHIILNIIQNSKEAFKKSEEKVKIIKIFGYTKEDKTYIDIIDNAGGIREDYLPYIFQENYTSKDDKAGSGLGLYLSKVILEGHLKGTIEASNTNDGAQFRIIL